LWEDNNSLQNKLEKEDCKSIFERNKKIIDFNEIPENLSNEFLEEFIKKTNI
jgi:hypothetical protein